MPRQVDALPLVRVRARLMAEYGSHCVLGFPDVDGKLQQITVALSDLAMRDDAADLCDAAIELMRKIESLIDIGLRVQAEAYELGGRKMRPNWRLRPIGNGT